MAPSHFDDSRVPVSGDVRHCAAQALQNLRRTQQRTIHAAIRPLFGQRVFKPFQAYLRQLTNKAAEKQKAYQRQSQNAFNQMKQRMARASEE